MPCNYSCDNINAICKVNEFFLIRKIFQQFFYFTGQYSLLTLFVWSLLLGGTIGHTSCHFCPYALILLFTKRFTKAIFTLL